MTLSDVEETRQHHGQSIPSRMPHSLVTIAHTAKGSVFCYFLHICTIILTCEILYILAFMFRFLLFFFYNLHHVIE